MTCQPTPNHSIFVAPRPGGSPVQHTALIDPAAEYWRVPRVARFLDISAKRVYKLVQEKKLVAIRLGPRQMRILRQSVDDYLYMLMESMDDENREWDEG